MRTPRGLQQFILDGERRPVPASMDEWVAWKMAAAPEDPARVAWNELPAGVLSTVFLGIDHRSLFAGPGPPVLFETALHRAADGAWDILHRWETWEAALGGHREIYRRLLREAAATEGAG